MSGKPPASGLGCSCGLCALPVPTPAPQTPEEGARRRAAAVEARRDWRARYGLPSGPAGRGTTHA